MGKRLFNIYNRERETNDYLKLTDNEIAFLRWLKDSGYLDDDTWFDEISTLPIAIEF